MRRMRLLVDIAQAARAAVALCMRRLRGLELPSKPERLALARMATLICLGILLVIVCALEDWLP